MGEAIARIGRADYDFNLKVLLPADVQHEITSSRRQRLIELSRKNYTCSRDKLNELLAREEIPTESQVTARVSFAPTPPAARIKKEKLAEKAAAESAELSNEEKSFLEFVHRHSNMSVTSALSLAN